MQLCSIDLVMQRFQEMLDLPMRGTGELYIIEINGMSQVTLPSIGRYGHAEKNHKPSNFVLIELSFTERGIPKVSGVCREVPHGKHSR